MQRGSRLSAAPVVIVVLLLYAVLFIASFSVTGLQSLAAAMFFLIAIGLPLWLR
jgi:hypothetical protein